MSEPDHPRMTADHVFAWIGEDDDGCEGILSFRDGGTGIQLPMVSTEEFMVEAMLPLVEELARREEYRNIRLVRYGATDVMTQL